MTRPNPRESIGHNGGPSLEGGTGFRRIAWARARKALMPNTAPIEILRRRVARAKALSLPYKTYAAIRAATGEDIEAMLFTSNALNLLRPHDALTKSQSERLAQIATSRHATLTKGLPPSALEPVPFKSIRPAPGFQDTWSSLSREMQSWLKSEQLPADRVLMIGETAFEREHAAAGNLAHFVTGQTIFAHSPATSHQ